MANWSSLLTETCCLGNIPALTWSIVTVDFVLLARISIIFLRA